MLSSLHGLFCVVCLMKSSDGNLSALLCTLTAIYWRYVKIWSSFSPGVCVASLCTAAVRFLALSMICCSNRLGFQSSLSTTCLSSLSNYAARSSSSLDMHSLGYHLRQKKARFRASSGARALGEFRTCARACKLQAKRNRTTTSLSWLRLAGTAS